MLRPGHEGVGCTAGAGAFLAASIADRSIRARTPCQPRRAGNRQCVAGQRRGVSDPGRCCYRARQTAHSWSFGRLQHKTTQSNDSYVHSGSGLCYSIPQQN